MSIDHDGRERGAYLCFGRAAEEKTIDLIEQRVLYCISNELYD